MQYVKLWPKLYELELKISSVKEEVEQHRHDIIYVKIKQKLSEQKELLSISLAARDAEGVQEA
ncbi:MAG: hypothetical protein MRQ13_04975 [Candidatus Midichloria sp.]|nr:hypothetical protein [Candidatus Midichloria sp.]